MTAGAAWVGPRAPAAGPDGASTGPPATPLPPRTPEPPAALPDISGLIARIRSYDPKADTDVVEAAFRLAAEAHREQKRDNGDPYITHPVAVAEILAGYRLDVGSIATALLHDVIEDTGISRAELERRFGPEIAGLVDGVTKLTRLELQSDRTKQAENFRKLVLAMSRDIRVLLVKLADRLHNMRTLHFVEQAARRLAHRPRNDGHLRAARRAHRHGMRSRTSCKPCPSPSWSRKPPKPSTPG